MTCHPTVFIFNLIQPLLRTKLKKNPAHHIFAIFFSFFFLFLFVKQHTLQPFDRLLPRLPRKLKDAFSYQSCGYCYVLTHSRQPVGLTWGTVGQWKTLSELIICQSDFVITLEIRAIVQTLAVWTVCECCLMEKMRRFCLSYRNTDSLCCRPICALSYILPAA